jgi:dTDP-4-amino-4,6-dideoxygalactose transaminase
MIWKIPLADLKLDDEEKEAVIKVLDSGWLTMGARVKDFELAFAQMLSSPFAFAVANGTVALHTACLALGIKSGDEVIIPSLTFVADANVVVQCGATPVFADIESINRLTISPEAIERAITPRTRAIMAMHYGGFACDLEKICEIAKSYNLFLIEDAAHAPGSTWNDRKLGAIGDIGCFSFFSNKNMTTGEGGMVVTADAGLAEKIGWIRSHGMTTLTWDRHQGHAWSYDVRFAGCNYRMDEIRAALGLVQLKKLKMNNQRRKELVQRYRENLLEARNPVSIPFTEEDLGASANHLFVVLLPPGIERNTVMSGLKEAGIQSSIHYPPIHQFTFYRSLLQDRNFELPVTEAVAQRLITLPLSAGMGEDQVDAVSERFISIVKSQVS